MIPPKPSRFKVLTFEGLNGSAIFDPVVLLPRVARNHKPTAPVIGA